MQYKESSESVLYISLHNVKRKRIEGNDENV